MLECASQTLKHVCYVFFIEPSIKISEYFSIFKRFYKFDLFPPLLFKFTLHHIEIRIESRLQPVQWTPIARPTYIRQQLDRNVLVPNIHTIHIQYNSKYFVPASPGSKNWNSIQPNVWGDDIVRLPVWRTFLSLSEREHYTLAYLCDLILSA